MAVCDVCFHHCDLKEGQFGLCMARRCLEDRVVCDNYGRITGFALDPIEKKPLYHFYPGSRILSIGSYGCNLRCPFCQNHTISYDLASVYEREQAVNSGIEKSSDRQTNSISPDRLISAAKEHSTFVSPVRLAELALSYVKEGNIGLAFTYNEPLIGYEYVLDTARLVKQAGLHTVLVTNGTAELSIIEQLLPVTDAMNIDLKGFTDRFYDKLIGGSKRMVMDTIEAAAGRCHLEVTTLIIPGENDSVDEITELAAYLAKIGRKVGVDIPLHLTRFFPRFRMKDHDATDIGHLFTLVDAAKEHLRYVHAGNV
ncbi:MAG: radical SAM protein [Lachnospiraceae bacterium]|nr:radical SAM protein [Lachnospiraceae bacterium]